MVKFDGVGYQNVSVSNALPSHLRISVQRYIAEIYAESIGRVRGYKIDPLCLSIIKEMSNHSCPSKPA